MEGGSGEDGKWCFRQQDNSLVEFL